MTVSLSWKRQRSWVGKLLWWNDWNLQKWALEGESHAEQRVWEIWLKVLGSLGECHTVLAEGKVLRGLERGTTNTFYGATSSATTGAIMGLKYQSSDHVEWKDFTEHISCQVEKPEKHITSVKINQHQREGSCRSVPNVF